MFGRGKTIAAAAAICIVVAFACGWSKPAWVKSGITGEGSKRGAWSAVGGSAGWDTLRVVFTMDRELDHYEKGYDDAVAAADTVIELGTDVAFAWDSIIRFSPFDAADQGLHYWPSSRNNTFALDDSVSGCSLGLFRIDFASVLPRNCTILDATLHMVPSTTMYTPRSDTLMAVLMTQPADTAWYKPAYLGVPAFGIDYLAHASWNNQVQGMDTGGYANRNYPATSSNSWSPKLNTRKYVWDWGTAWDYSKLEAMRPNATFPSVTDTLWNYYNQWYHARLTIRNCVQAVVNGETNNGIMWFQYGTGSGSGAVMRAAGWETSTPTGGTPQEGTIVPWVTVTYTTKKYRPMFGTSDFALVFSTDDGFAVNASYDSVFALRDQDFNFTIGFEGFQPDASGRLTTAQILALHDRGNEIASHGYHPPEYTGQPDPFGGTIVAGYDGMNFYRQGGDIVNYVRGMSQSGLAAPGTTGYDSTCFQMDTAWLDSMATANGRADLLDSPRWGVGFQTPNAGMSIDMTRAIADVGLSWVRGLPTAASTANPTSGYLERRRVMATLSGAPGYAIADSAYLGLPFAQRTRPVNMRLFPTSMDMRSIFTALNGTPTEAQVRYNLMKALAQIRGDGMGVLAIVTHKQKSASQDGLDLDEAGWMADVMNEWGGRMLTWNEYATYIRSRARPVATPTGWNQAEKYRFDAADAVWYVAGQPQAIYALDTTPPPPPENVIASGFDGSVVLTWNTNGPGDPQRWKVYRFYDGSADTTYLGLALSGFYQDADVVNGSPHNYFVTALDSYGNEGADSDHVAATPGSILSVGRPAYAALWFQNIAAGTSLTSAQLDSLAAYDALITWTYPYRTGAQNEASMDNLLSNLRARNSDILLLAYMIPLTPDVAWASYQAGSPERRQWDYCVAAGGDSSGFGRNLAGYVAESDAYPTLFTNIMYPDIADTLAKFWVEAFDATDSDGEYSGLFVDLADTTLSAHLCYEDGCTAAMDYDQDATAYASDADEKAAHKQFYIDFFRAVRREFAERSMPNRLLVANGNFGRKTPALQTAADSTVTGLLDGVLVESFNKYFPGSGASSANWEKVYYQQEMLRRSQVSPPLAIYSIEADSSTQYMGEPVALAFDGFAMGNSGMDNNGESAIPPLYRRLPPATVYSGYSFSGGTPDTLTATWSNLTARLVLSRNSSAPDDTFAVWPYLITRADGTILSRSAFWELPNEVGPPSLVIQIHDGGAGDRRNTLTWEITSGSLPSDFSRWRIYRDPCDGCTDFIYDDNPTVYYSAEFGQAYSWTDTAVTNGVQYEYQIVAVDHNGQDSDPIASDPMTPYDDTAPGVPQNLVASGGAGYIDLDWTYPAFPADFEHFRIWRRITGSGLAFTLTDSVAISAHQDSTATSGTEYDYYVVAVDDDENASAASDTVVGSWYGDIEETYLPPTLVRALADNPTGRTSVVVYPPTDVTGLTGYSIYRGPYTGFASIDTAACVLYKQNIAPDIFNGAVFEDQHANTNPDSAFQYTARALYSGNASIKYPVPASALTTGGFSAQVPSCIAYGTGSDIAVAVVVLAGADSTRIFRGTSSGSQAYLTTVPIGTNPWTDSTATANTDYWYKVRQVDGALVSEFSAVAGPARWTSTPSGDPSISGVTNSSDVDHGETLTISGANFGTKATAAPQLYNDFDSYSEDQVATTAHGWSSVDAYGDGSGPWTLPVYSSDAGHVGKGLKGRFEGRTAISRVRVDRNWSGGVYLDYWYRHIEAEARSRNLKPWRFYGTGALELPQLNLFMQCADGSVQLPVSPSSAGPNYYMTSAENLVNQMRHWQFWLKPDVDGGTNGYMKVMLDGQVIEEHTGWGTNGPGLIGEYWAQLSISGYYSRSVEGGCPPAYITGNAYEYWDNLYIDNTQARVEIGNASTYAACTHREIQIPSAWSATSITCTVNTGSFSSGAAYLFVIDEDGVPSAGKAITISASKQAFDYKHVDYIVGGQSFRIENVDWDTGVTGSMTIRAVEQFSGSVVDEDTSSSGNPAIGPTLTGLVPGTQYRIEYTTDTDDEDYEPKSTWSTLFGPYTQPPKSAEEDGSIGQ